MIILPAGYAPSRKQGAYFISKNGPEEEEEQEDSGVAQKHTTQAHARREITQGNGGAQKKATQGVVGRVISPVQERVQERLLVRSAVILHPALLPLQIAVW
jgi:hypothetical protein